MEYAAQFLQLRHGRKAPSLREPRSSMQVRMMVWRRASRFGIGRAQAYRICEFQQWTGDIVRWP